MKVNGGLCWGHRAVFIYLLLQCLLIQYFEIICLFIFFTIHFNFGLSFCNFAFVICISVFYICINLNSFKLFIVLVILVLRLGTSVSCNILNFSSNIMFILFHFTCISSNEKF